MAPMAAQVDALVERLEELEIRTIAPAWPCHRRELAKPVQRLPALGERHQQASLSVTLLFASAYGNTKAIADALAQGVNRTGVRVNSLNCTTPPMN